ncbi:MAG: endolytic transglycosylase MltG [Patescibacteria group bacterium]|nr:endolytic transglycosylase MltG [Patescibacteria group bacterium]
MLKSKLILIIVSLLAGLLALGAGVIWQLLQPVNPSAQTPQKFVVAKGESISSIGDKLTQTGLLRHPLVFRGAVYYLQNSWTTTGTSIQAGSFELSPAMNIWQIVKRLTQGSDDVWLTLLEGWRVEEIAQVAQNKLTNFSVPDFLDLARPLEGQLFPDTYLVPLEFSPDQLTTLLTTTFEKKVTTGLAEEIAGSDRPLEEVIILASLVEREARGYDQMRQVAGVLEHRLKIGMALQVDATLQYAKGPSTQGEWWAPPLVGDKKIVSPYNTYLHPGLPPRPICNPGLEAIRAVLNPIETDNLYYLHAPDGQIYFAQTLEEHNRNVAKYL